MSSRLKAAVLALALVWIPCAAALATNAPLPPQDLDARAGWDQRIGAQLPEDLRLRDANGTPVTLSELSAGKPVLLSLGYYRCPNLCGMVLHGLGDAAGSMALQPGSDYQVAFLSVDPNETPADAKSTQDRLVKMHPQAHVEHWHLLTGDAQSIRALADAVGFRYFYDERNRQYAHPSGAVVLTSGDRAAQYFFGLPLPTRALRLALVDASRGKLGGVIDHLVLLCSGYDPTTGRYSLRIVRVMQVLGVVFVLAFAAVLLLLRRRGRATR